MSDWRSRRDGRHYPVNGHRVYPNNTMSHPDRSTKIFKPEDGKIIVGRQEHGEALILDNVVYDPFSENVSLETSKKERDILISRGDEAIVRENTGGKYQVWVRSR